ncbi:hypothetical protein GWK47_023508 [Chionoecetes opilio]|uniref:RRM domain-containing protein n=1 Tax=Chionoecetes opilio TaxID=41210 RepID=A0A8J5CEI5_CHIOP|nr:hypothetical protein GWK47_023508 [Chionoecetes opilio]
MSTGRHPTVSGLHPASTPAYSGRLAPPPASITRTAGQTGGVRQRPRGLYIKNVPATMTAEGLRRLFGEHGQVESVVVGRATPHTTRPRWAIVNPHTTRDAVAMLLAVNGRPPLCLEVTPAVTPEEKQRQRRSREAQHSFLEEVRRDVAAAGVESSTPVNPASSDYASTITTTVTTTPAITTTTPAITTTTPAITTTTTTTTPAITTASHQDVIQAPFEAGCGVVVVEQRAALPCVWCGVEGQLVCGGCAVWYCGRLCQAAHWPLHATSCTPPPPATSLSTSSNIGEYWNDISRTRTNICVDKMMWFEQLKTQDDTRTRHRKCEE